MIRLILTLFTLFLFSCGSKDTMEKIFAIDESLSRFIENKDSLEIAIIYTMIDRDSTNSPSFKTNTFNYDSAKYFYPASTVKFPIALLALEKLNQLNIPGLTRETTLLTDSSFFGQTAVSIDSSSQTNYPSVGHYIKKIFQVSDNDAFNRLYEFLGQDYINNRLNSKGYTGTNIVHRLSQALSAEQNQNTNPVSFLIADTILFHQPNIKAKNIYSREKVLNGRGYLKNGNLISEPMDFSNKNLFPLHEQHLMLKNIIFPETAKQGKFELTTEDYTFLYRWMSTVPGESLFPNYSNLPENYVKFLMFGKGKKNLPKNIKVFNKVGVAYGYVTDNAYIIDIENNIEFLLTAVIHTNANKIYNDGNYEYDSIAYPFMEELGKSVYQYEFSRKKTYKPNLKKYYLF